MTFDCGYEEWLEWKDNVVQEDVMKNGIKFNGASGEARAPEAKRVLRRLSDFAQDAAAVEAEGANVAIGYGDGCDRILQCGRLDGVIDADWFLKGEVRSFNHVVNPGILFIHGTKRSKNVFYFRTSPASYVIHAQNQRMPSKGHQHNREPWEDPHIKVRHYETALEGWHK